MTAISSAIVFVLLTLLWQVFFAFQTQSLQQLRTAHEVNS